MIGYHYNQHVVEFCEKQYLFYNKATKVLLDLEASDNLAGDSEYINECIYILAQQDENWDDQHSNEIIDQDRANWQVRTARETQHTYIY